MMNQNGISIQKEGYHQLINICLQESKRSELRSFVDHMENYDGHEDYITILNFLMRYLDINGIHFIMALDWKADIPTLIWRIDSSLLNNFRLQVALPKTLHYPKNASVSFDNIFRDFDNPLHAIGKQIGFIDTESDEYVIFIHDIKDKEAAINAVNKIGYTYFDASSKKANTKVEK